MVTTSEKPGRRARAAASRQGSAAQGRRLSGDVEGPLFAVAAIQVEPTPALQSSTRVPPKISGTDEYFRDVQSGSKISSAVSPGCSWSIASNLAEFWFGLHNTIIKGNFKNVLLRFDGFFRNQNTIEIY